MSTENDIERIEEEIKSTPYNKATQGHIGKLKAKLAKLKSEKEKASAGGRSVGFSVKKSGDATVLLVGHPSVGKSTLINKITNVESKTGIYDFTTIDVIPGMLEYNGARIQILDIPGIIADAASGRGKGKRVLSVVRNADLIAIVVDDIRQSRVIKKELFNAGFRLDQRPPDVKITKRDTGGVNINIAVKKPKLDSAAVRSVLSEFKIHNADVLIRENISLDQFVDSMMKNRVYVPSLVVLNKIDTMDDIDFKKTGEDVVAVSATVGMNLEGLRKAFWEKLSLARIYMKRPGKEADTKEPLIMKRGCTVMDVAGKIMRVNSKYLKYARIWGPSAKFPGQKVGAEHKLKDKDTVELRS